VPWRCGRSRWSTPRTPPTATGSAREARSPCGRREFWRFPCWADRADLLFAEAAGWDHPIRFRGGVGGHASVAQVAAEAARRGVRRLVYAHIGRLSLRAMDAGLQPPFSEWGAERRTYILAD